MSKITKEYLLDQISDAVKEAEENKKSSEFPGLYDSSIYLLKKLNNTVEADGNLTKEEFKTESISFGLFSVREVAIYDKKFSNRLCHLIDSYDTYYDLLDPDIEELITLSKKEKIESYTNELLNSANERGTKQGAAVYKAILDMLKKAKDEDEVNTILLKLNKSLGAIEAHSDLTDDEFICIKELRAKDKK